MTHQIWAWAVANKAFLMLLCYTILNAINGALPVSDKLLHQLLDALMYVVRADDSRSVKIPFTRSAVPMGAPPLKQ